MNDDSRTARIPPPPRAVTGPGTATASAREPDVPDRVRAPLRRSRPGLDRRPRDSARRHLPDAQRRRQQLVHRGDPHPDGRRSAPRCCSASASGCTKGRGASRWPASLWPIAIPGLYATTVVATQTYDLISPVLGLEAAALIGVIGVFIAVRWSSMLVGSVGMLGALAAPMLGRDRERRRFDRLRRPGPRRQRRRPPLAALELAGARRLRRLGAPADRLDLSRTDSSASRGEDPERAHPARRSRSWSGSGSSTPPPPSATSCGIARRRGSRSLPGCCFSAAACWWSAPAASSSAAIRRSHWTPGSSVSPPSICLLGGAAIRFGIHREIGSLLIGGGIGLGSLRPGQRLRRPDPGGRLVGRWPPRSPIWRRERTATPDRRRSRTRNGC